MNSPQDTYGKRNDNRINAVLLGTAIFGLLFAIIGIILLSNYTTYDGYEIVKDYTDCTSIETPPNQIKCKDSLNSTGEPCSCYIKMEVTKVMKAPVTVFYELDSYDQISSSYAQSRDDNQLAGHLFLEPAASCGAYTYTTEKKPIAPCGQLADAMFNDTFSLQINNEYISYIRTGLISEDDKKLFYNPPGNLSQAFKDFSKPINWRKNVWELDINNPENNGFQVLVALAFYASGSYQTIVGDSRNHFISQASVSKAIRQVTTALNNPAVLNKYIAFPFKQCEREQVKRDFYHKFKMPALGCIDGTHVAIVCPAEHEERFFNRKGYHSLNVMINEAFIIWMNTDLKRKPAWRVNQTGLYEHGVAPANYTLRVIYGYPPSRYDGPRKFIISSVHEIVNSVKYGFGVALLVIGLPCFVFAGVLLFMRRSTISWRL